MKNLSLLVFAIAIALKAYPQVSLKSPQDLKNWLPAEIAGYEAGKEDYSDELSQDGNSYFISAKKYTKGQSVISIVAFDYRKKSENITKATTLWEANKKMEDDKLYSINSMVAGCKAQETLDKAKNTAQLYLYYADRYLITLAATGENLDFLKTVAGSLPLTSLPE
jgi:hypothetical protein